VGYVFLQDTFFYTVARTVQFSHSKKETTGGLISYKGDTRVPADNGDLSLKDEDVRDNETNIKDNDSKFGGN
jgi:hypothetical protein